MCKLSFTEFKALAPSMNLKTLSKTKDELMEKRLKEVDQLQVRFNSTPESYKETLELINDLQRSLLRESGTILAIYRQYAK